MCTHILSACKRMAVFLIISCLCLLSFSVYAQHDNLVLFRQPVSLRFTYQLLHSTHKDNFNGGSVDLNFSTSKHIILGAGVQYAGTHLHYDNGWVLTNLRMLPVYLNSFYVFCPHSQVQPYLHTEEGISFNHYNKVNTALSPLSYKVSETGLYLSGNLGSRVMISDDVNGFTEIGYKGYKHSVNDLDVNPHGVTLRSGFEFYQ